MDPDPLPFLSSFFLIANVVWIQLGLALLLLLCSALVSGAEVAFFSLQLKSLEELYETNNETEVKRVIHLLRKPKRLLATSSHKSKFKYGLSFGVGCPFFIKY